MTEEYKAKVRALADMFYRQGYPAIECILKAEATLRLQQLIGFAQKL